MRHTTSLIRTKDDGRFNTDLLGWAVLKAKAVRRPLLFIFIFEDCSWFK